MSFYDEYKPLRNRMRRTNIEEGLYDLWVYSAHLMDDRGLPMDYMKDAHFSTRSSLKKNVFPWDIDTLSRELLLNGGEQRDYRFKTWRDFSIAVNHLRRLDNVNHKSGAGLQDVFLELHRIAQRQFHWQMHRPAMMYSRAIKIFGESSVNGILCREYGLTTEQYISIGMAISGHLIHDPIYQTNNEEAFLEVLGVQPDALRSLYGRISASNVELKEMIQRDVTYDGDWLYRWNPLEAKPLVRIHGRNYERTLCPIPYYVARRTSSGIFYDLVSKSGFDNAFGKAFEAYIGDVIDVTCPQSCFTVLPETKYSVGLDEKHGVDWVFSDSTGFIAIECKTKRLTLHARFLTDSEALDKDISAMADAIVQLYQNIRDALLGHAPWSPHELPVYPMVVTLEDWYIFSPTIREMLAVAVNKKMADTKLDLTLVTKYPYTIASAAEIEIVFQLIARHNISSFMKKVVGPDRSGWSLLPLARHDFPEDMAALNYNLFSAAFDDLLPVWRPS